MHITPRGQWYDNLDMHVPTKDKSDDKKDIFYDEL
jgi:hypothetical protein